MLLWGRWLSTAELVRYGFVIERTEKGFSAYVPALPGCVATGATMAQVRKRVQEAIEILLKSMMADGDPIPEPTTEREYVDLTKPRKKSKAGRSSRITTL
jgi:predicted RNase H-like HicB family nuclease